MDNEQEYYELQIVWIEKEIEKNLEKISYHVNELEKLKNENKKKREEIRKLKDNSSHG